MAEEKILTMHPQADKKGKNISKTAYELFKAAILNALADTSLTHTELYAAVTAQLEGTFEGNIHWYTETVKLDLEARKLIVRSHTTPATYTLA